MTDDIASEERPDAEEREEINALLLGAPSYFINGSVLSFSSQVTRIIFMDRPVDGRPPKSACVVIMATEVLEALRDGIERAIAINQASVTSAAKSHGRPN